MVPQLITLISQRFFYLTEKVLKGVGFIGNYWIRGNDEVSLPLLRFNIYITNLNNIFSVDSFFSNLTFFVDRMDF
jgi:hypothetical protein